MTGMTKRGSVRGGPSSGVRLARRTALLAPLALGGCSLWDDWFSTKKTPLAGKRESVLSGRGGLNVDDGVPKVVLPPAVPNASWPQAGGNPTHYMGHLAAGDRLAEAWRTDIGAGGGYRRKIMAQPVAANGVVYVMDSDAVVSAFDIAGGGRVWRFDTKKDDDDSTNIGGGLAVDQGTLYAVNGLAEVVALDAAKGTVRWRRPSARRAARRRQWSRAASSSPPSRTGWWRSRPMTGGSSGLISRRPRRPACSAGRRRRIPTVCSWRASIPASW